jgi:nicotinate-nucleotide adenylyltransferase
MNWKKMEVRLKQDLSYKRFTHSLGVRYTAACLAMHYGCDIDKAMLAGGLHDCAKHLSDEELINECKQNNIDISKTEANSPYLLHTKVGVLYAKTIYGVEDDEVLGAIRYHTTGRPEMTLLEKIIFTSDYIEPNRKWGDELAIFRRQVFQHLDRTVALVLEDMVRYHQETKQELGVDEITTQSYQYYKRYLNEGSEHGGI